MPILIFFLILIGLIVLVVVGAAFVRGTEERKNKKYRRASPPTTFNSMYRPGTFCGAFGSPGMSPKIVGSHFRDCQCMICYYGHDPEAKPNCQCRSCQADRRGQPLF